MRFHAAIVLLSRAVNRDWKSSSSATIHWAPTLAASVIAIRYRSGVMTCFSGGKLPIQTVRAFRLRMKRTNPELVSIQGALLGPAAAEPLLLKMRIPGHTA